MCTGVICCQVRDWEIEYWIGVRTALMLALHQNAPVRRAVSWKANLSVYWTTSALTLIPVTSFEAKKE